MKLTSPPAQGKPGIMHVATNRNPIGQPFIRTVLERGHLRLPKETGAVYMQHGSTHLAARCRIATYVLHPLGEWD
jgi:hypothetical protein